MQNRYPLWKTICLALVAIIGLLYALPNLYGEDPALQVAPRSSSNTLTADDVSTIQSSLNAAHVKIKAIAKSSEGVVIRFYDTDTQVKAKDIVNGLFDERYTVAPTILPATPVWLSALHAEPMKLGLDLRGGVHFLLEVDLDSIIARREEVMMKSIAQTLREQGIRYIGLARSANQGILIRFRDEASRDAAKSKLSHSESDTLITEQNTANQPALQVQLSPSSIQSLRQYTVEQTMSTLRNRVNELGVAEAMVQQQGVNRIAVDLPGIQDATRAKEILGGTATLEFRMVDDKNDPEAASTGLVPVGSRLYQYHGRPLLLSNQIILSGDAISSAHSEFDERTGGPAVSISLGSGNIGLFTQTTRDNIGKSMAIISVETKTKANVVNGEVKRESHKEENIISVAVINSGLGTHFQITGLHDMNEAANLALFLRAGALPATIYPIEERIVGPTLGLENIKRGLISLEVGMGIILFLMLIYYRVFGLIANIALVFNLILLIAILSMIDATLTLPGIAGIVLTVGMAVDANVLIYERIREELRAGVSPQGAIHAGYERAFSTIVDANITTLIVALALFGIGSGPVKGFAVVLSIGLLTSMVTGIAFTRALVNVIYGQRRVEKLSIGI